MLMGLYIDKSVVLIVSVKESIHGFYSIKSIKL